MAEVLIPDWSALRTIVQAVFGAGTPVQSKRVAAFLLVSVTMIILYALGMTSQEVLAVGDHLVPVALLLIGGESVKDAIAELRAVRSAKNAGSTSAA